MEWSLLHFYNILLLLTLAHSCNHAVQSYLFVVVFSLYFLVRSLFLFKQMLSVQFNESRERIDLNYGLFEYGNRAPEIH